MPDKRNKYLIIQTAFLGDTALSLCMARYIKSRDKMAEVFFMTTPASAVTAELCPDIDEVLIYDKRSKNSGLLGLFRTIRMVRSFSFDAVFCPHRSFRSAILSYFSVSPFRYGYHK
ncbi:MAG: glycosyltransferase family 9 protein, partial [Fibrobacterota bacterium]